MFRKILCISVLAFFINPVPTRGAMDFLVRQKLDSDLASLETVYSDGKWDEAITRARDLMKETPQDDPIRRRANDLLVLALEFQAQEKLKQEHDAKVELNKKNSRELIKEASDMLKKKDYSEAQSKIRTAIDLHEGNAEAYFALGFAEQNNGSLKEAYSAYKKCLDLDKRHPKALFHISQLSLKQKNFKEARMYSRLLIEVIDSRISDLSDQRIRLKAMKLNDKADAAGVKITDLNKNLAQASFVYGVLSEAEGELQDAYTSLRRAVRLNPSDPEGYYQLGKTLLGLKISHQAALAFEQAISIYELRLRDQQTSVKTLLDEGKTDQAVDAELKARSLSDKLALSWYGHAMAFWRRSDSMQAIESVEKALKFKSDFTQARFARAVFLVERNNYQEALSEMREILRSAPPNSKQAKKAIDAVKMILDKLAAKEKAVPDKKIAEALASPRIDTAVKDMPGLGGRAAEEEWQEVFPKIREIQDLLKRRNIPEAVRRLIYLQNHHPAIAEIPAVLGHCYMEQGRLGDAEKSFKRALDINPRNSDSLSNLAYIYAIRGEKLDIALKMAQQAVSIDELRSEYRHTLGWVLFKTGEIEKAMVELEQALQIKSDYVLARYNLGLAAYLTANYDKALEAFDGVLKVNSGHVKAMLFKAITLAKAKRAKEAIEVLEELRKLLPETETLRRVVEDYHSKLSLACERHTDLPVPQIKSPAPIDRLLKDARSYRAKGLVTKAREKYLECNRLAPVEFQPYYELGDMYARSGLNQAALNAWNQALKISPDHYALQAGLGKVYYALHRRSESREAFVKAQALNLSEAEPHYYLGLIAYEERRFESAESHALAALRLSPRFFKAMALLGMSRIRLERLKPARDIYETLYAQAPSGSSIQRHARKKLWELVRLMAPNRAPSYENVTQVQAEITRRITKDSEGQRQFSPAPADEKAYQQYGSMMTPQDKIWVLQQLDKFGAIKTPTPIAPLKPDVTTNTLTSQEKRWVLDKLGKFKTQRDKYAPPVTQDGSKYRYENKKPARGPDKADEFLKNGIAFAEKGLISEALAELHRAREVSPANIDVLLNLAYINLLTGNFKDSFDAAAQAVFHHPKVSAARLFLGNLFWLGGKASEAIEQWHSMIDPVEFSEEFHLIARAEKTWKQLLDVNSADADAHSQLGIVFMFSNRFPEAITEFRNVLSLDPNRPDHKFYEAQAHVLLFLNNKNATNKREATRILRELTAESFPHADQLRAFVNSL